MNLTLSIPNRTAIYLDWNWNISQNQACLSYFWWFCQLYYLRAPRTFGRQSWNQCSIVSDQGTHLSAKQKKTQHHGFYLFYTLSSISDIANMTEDMEWHLEVILCSGKIPRKDEVPSWIYWMFPKSAIIMWSPVSVYENVKPKSQAWRSWWLCLFA